MCYPKPGPRCSRHAGDELIAARLDKNPERIRIAQLAYDITPAGIRTLRNAGRDAEADLATATRKAQLAAYQAHRSGHFDLDTALNAPHGTDPDPSGYSPVEKALLIEDLDAASINRALDALENREQARMLAYARTH